MIKRRLLDYGTFSSGSFSEVFSVVDPESGMLSWPFFFVIIRMLEITQEEERSNESFNVKEYYDRKPN